MTDDTYRLPRKLIVEIEIDWEDAYDLEAQDLKDRYLIFEETHFEFWLNDLPTKVYWHDEHNMTVHEAADNT